MEEEDGIRILVDRVWPRGMSKERLHADYWMKDAAPSAALRKLNLRYLSELDDKPDIIQYWN
ncbi:DUF488 family protein [Dissulfurimicrobium hydrothermale]|nr:DUF488 family protein [Dissulfurimicrobium hydrothermale]